METKRQRIERDYLWAIAGLLTSLADEATQAFNVCWEREKDNPRLAWIRPCAVEWVDGERLNIELEVAHEKEEAPVDAHAN